MASTRKKTDEKYQKILRELASIPANKHCFDCHQRGPTYVNVTIGSFVCTRCSGILRGLTPPHRVKSISMATFNQEEVELLKTRGNEYCKRVWLGLCYTEEPTKDEQQIKDFMIAKYEKKRYYLEEGATPEAFTNSKPTVNGWSNHSSPSSPQISTTKPLPPPQAKNGLTMGTSVIAQPHQNGFRTPARDERRDPFSPSAESAQSSFANFENNPIYTATPTSPPSYAGGPISEDRYAALKDLDSLMKSQMASTAPASDWTLGVSEVAKVPQESSSTVVNGFWPPTQASVGPSVNFFQNTPTTLPPPRQSSNPFAYNESSWSDGSSTYFGNPFTSARPESETAGTGGWGLTNGTNGALTTSQSLQFGGKLPWTVSPANPFSNSQQQQFVGCGLPAKGHHSSNPFL